jgi:hypothetical protein
MADNHEVLIGSLETEGDVGSLSAGRSSCTMSVFLWLLHSTWRFSHVLGGGAVCFKYPEMLSSQRLGACA